ncbi:MAG: hypothetical protein JXL84_04720 [Deltaproteobacteria bacterium]|nr:hypothetical protein [Deltaproteobacteria bacterium]
MEVITTEVTGGNRTRAVRILGIGIRALQRKLRPSWEYGGASL